MALSDLPFPEINASLNFTATVLLITGYIFIRKGLRDAHRRTMVLALAASAVFLASYLTSKYIAHRMDTPYVGRWKPAYFAILLTHIPLAASLLFFVPWTVVPAIEGNFEKHRRRAKITLPIWIYVSVTGVLVYVFLRYSGSFDAAAGVLPSTK